MPCISIALLDLLYEENQNLNLSPLLVTADFYFIFNKKHILLEFASG